MQKNILTPYVCFPVLCISLAVEIFITTLRILHIPTVVTIMSLIKCFVYCDISINRADKSNLATSFSVWPCKPIISCNYLLRVPIFVRTKKSFTLNVSNGWHQINISLTWHLLLVFWIKKEYINQYYSKRNIRENSLVVQGKYIRNTR